MIDGLAVKQGLQELYNFKKQNPDANLAPFLDKSSQYFRDYIEKGLKKIELELGGGGGGGQNGPSNGGGKFGFGGLGGGPSSVLADSASGNTQQGGNSIEFVWPEKPLEFWLEIPCTNKSSKIGSFDM